MYNAIHDFKLNLFIQILSLQILVLLCDSILVQSFVAKYYENKSNSIRNVVLANVLAIQNLIKNDKAK